MRYIHYGHRCFVPHDFQPVTNRPYMPKPNGGIWGSRIDAKYGWIDWCKDNEFTLHRWQKYFTFELKPDANVLYINNALQLKTIPKCIQTSSEHSVLWKCIDFEQLLNSGIDAIEVEISQDDQLYWDLYGWDCDSILIMNPDIIVT